MTQIYDILHDIYYDPSNNAAFSSIDRLYKEARKRIPNIKLSTVKDFLNKQFSYTLHKPVRHNFKRNRVLASRPNEHWQADLVDMQAYSKDNDGYKYILMIIDVFSKMLQAIPLKTKNANEMKSAFIKAFQDQSPDFLFTEEGSEFTNTIVRSYFEEMEVHHLVAQNKETKAAVVERVNRTIKSRMFKYFTSLGKHKWLDVLPQLVTAYNHSYHRSIKMRPVDVSLSNVKKVFQNLYGCRNEIEYLQTSKKAPKAKPGDFVRIKYKYNTFDKGYYPYWRDKVFTIKSVNTSTSKPTYTLVYGNQTLKKRFYEEEIQPIPYPEKWRIEKIIRRDRRNHRLLIRWKDYGPEDDSWITEEEFESLS